MHMLARTYRYFRAAPWPHGTALGALALCAFLGRNAWTLEKQGHACEASLLILWAAGWLIVALFACADGIARNREYARIKSMLARYGFKRRLIKPLARSRCQRDAALLAARETGHLSQTADYFRELGYRWYHIMPDSVVRNPLAFISPAFLKTSFLPGKKLRHHQGK